MVIAYWLSGREIVLEIQGGKERAEYGKQLIEQLSQQLTLKYGRGFSTTNLRYFRTFYTVYADRDPEIRHITGGELDTNKKRHIQSGVLDDMTQAVEKTETSMGFSPNLGWTHYRALMNVENRNERLFYEIETEKEGWGVELLERQIHTFLFASKICELTHQDVGQMDSYVRMYDDKYLTEGDNPTIGLILCAKKNETIAKYSVLKDSRQIFASKYMLYLPTEEELQRELQRERLLIEKQSNKTT